MVKNPPVNAGDRGSIPRSGRSPGGGHSNPLQYSCLENSMDRGAWWATVHGVAELEHACKGKKPSEMAIYYSITNICLSGKGRTMETVKKSAVFRVRRGRQEINRLSTGDFLRH